jgi:hypothetical protein
MTWQTIVNRVKLKAENSYNNSQEEGIIILNKSGLALSIPIQLGRILKEIAIVIRYLLIGLIGLVVRKVRAAT